VRECGRVVSEGDGRLVEGVLTDVTADRRRTIGHEQYRELVENVGDPMYVLDAGGRIELLNQALADFLGYEREEAEGSHASEIFSATVVERAEGVIRELLSKPSDDQTVTWEVSMENTAGERRPVQIRTGIICDENGAYRGSGGVIRDITEQRERERELERYETIIQAVGDPVYTLDANGRFTFINDAMVRRFGYDAEELVGEHVATLLDDETVVRSREHIAQLLANDDRQSAKFEISPATKNGEEIPSEEGFRGTAGVVRDITDRKQREERLEQFTSVVSHDLRGPLSSLSARAELARETGEEEHFDEIDRSVERMERLIDDLLTLARHGDVVGETERVSLASLANRAWSSLETGTAELSIDAEQQLEADPERLQERLENLFRNSFQHAAHPDAGPSVRVRVGALDDEPGFYVADDGPGIDPDHSEEVFEHGYTTSEDGTGFGLSIVERIVTAHDWRISVTDSRRGGARFEVRTD